MLAGHVGVALALGAAPRRPRLGTLVLAALGLDIVLWTLVLCGVETVSVPPDYARRHELAFVFPYSHGLAAAAAWSLAAAALAAIAAPAAARRPWALLVAGAVFSHWGLDALVHGPELPLWGESSPHVGLALWDRAPLALATESAITLAGLAVWLHAARAPRARGAGIVALTLLTLALSIAGLTLAPAPPGPRALASASLGSIALIAAAAALLDRTAPRRRHANGAQAAAARRAGRM